MPTFAAQTTAIEQGKYPDGAIWKSPDGQRSMWKITMTTAEGHPAAGLKTYSQAIAQVGWKGQVETYEKQGNQGVETFVKQPQQAPEQAPAGPAHNQGSSFPKPQTDPFTMYLSYAKDVYCAMISVNPDRSFSRADFLVELNKVVAGGEFLYDQRPGNPDRKQPDDPRPLHDPAAPTIQELNQVFPGVAADNGSSPWPTANQ